MVRVWPVSSAAFKRKMLGLKVRRKALLLQKVYLVNSIQNVERQLFELENHYKVVELEK